LPYSSRVTWSFGAELSNRLEYITTREGLVPVVIVRNDDDDDDDDDDRWIRFGVKASDNSVLDATAAAAINVRLSGFI